MHRSRGSPGPGRSRARKIALIQAMNRPELTKRPPIRGHRRVDEDVAVPIPHRPGLAELSGSSAIAGFRPHRSHRAALPQWALQKGPEAGRSSGRFVHTREVRLQGLPALCLALRLPRRDPFLPLPFLHRLVSFGDFIDSMERSDSIRDAANYGCPSFAAPTGDRRWTLMGLIGSGMRLLAVTWSKPPAEHPVSRMTRPDVLLSLVRAPALPPPHADFGSQFHTASYRCLRFGPRVAATPARLAPVPPARF